MLRHALLLMLVPIGCAQATEPLAVTLNERAQVSGERLELGEIAEIAGPADRAERLASLDLGPAPLPGRSRTLSLGYVRMRLRRWGLGEPEVVLAGAPEVAISTPPVAAVAPSSATMEPPAVQEAVASPPVTVKRGSAVRLQVNCGAVTIIAGATTLEDAAVGGMVKLRVDQTRRTTWAKLDSPRHATMTR